MTNTSLDFSYAYGKPEQTLVFRSTNEDFVVDELHDELLSGDGEHFWLRIKKSGENTDWLAGKLANYFAVEKMDVGYAGKKDRHAITLQWFSIYLPGKAHTIDWPQFIEQSGADAELLDSGTHHRKLRRGDHSANLFRIRLRDAVYTDELEERLKRISHQGVPNYFGEQRFGRNGNNLDKIEAWAQDPRAIRDRNLRGLLMSAARSYLFNCVLSQRIVDQNWRSDIDGEPEPEPSAPLWGRGRNLALRALLELEEAVLSPYTSWCSVLENVGLHQERRCLILTPQHFSWRFESGCLAVSMTLAPGQYATSVLREIAQLGPVNRP